MMETDTLLQIRYHAGLEQIWNSDVPSLAEVLWRKVAIHASFNDLLDVLQIVNIEMNGAVPSGMGDKASSFPRSLVYAVSEILRMLRILSREAGANNDGEELNKFAWRLEVAWLAVLAGDIDNLREHIIGEEVARGT